MLHISVRHDGRRIVIPIMLFAPEPPEKLEGVEATALIDTGATISGITPRMVRRLGLENLGKRPLGSARGEEQAERHLVRFGFNADPGDSDSPTFPYIFDAKMVFALTDAFHLDALIGMDILRECDFEMTRQGRCTLRFGN